MSTTMTAKEVSEAWLIFINDTFMTENGCNRPTVIEEFRRLDTSGKLMQARENGRVETDYWIEEILQTPAESRREKYSTIDSRSLVLVSDRVQFGTQLLKEFVQQGRQINIEGVASLEDFFRQMLLQRPATPESTPEAPEVPETTEAPEA
ncbi:MAG TPA: hypothetical protein VN642_07765 [Dongiaceae bacterium]|nr:hypothetical protein [Dongiaceae bacterium]